MSTNIKYVKQLSPAAQRRREIRRRKRNIRMILFCILICAIIVMAFTHHKEVQALNDQVLDRTGQIMQLTDQVTKLEDQVTRLEDENQDLSAALQEAEDKLRMFVDTTEVKAEDVTIYNIPLDAALQEYTYNLCVDYYIPEHYELVLAMMWHESNYEADVVSRTNDYGLMQINKNNHRWLSEELGIDDFLDPYQNIHAGVYMISRLLLKYDDTNKALMAYNMGERGASTFWSSGIYSTKYSRSILAKLDAILINDYRG